MNDARENKDPGTECKTHDKTDEDSGNKPGSKKPPAKGFEDIDSDGEGAFSRFSSLQRESLGISYLGPHRLPSLPQRRAKAARRLMQTKAYAELIEERILELERKVQSLSNDETPLVEAGRSKRDVPTLLQAVPMGWSEFNSRANFNVSRKDYPGYWPHRPELDDASKPVIEILTEEPRYGSFPTDFYSHPSDVTKLHCVRHVPSPLENQHSLAEPYRIRIRSKLLLKLIKQLTGCNVLRGPHEHRLLMLRPFKLLVRFAEDIRKHAQDLAEGINNGRPVPEMKSQEAIDQLNLLTDTINKYLSHPLSLQKSIDHRVTKIAFSQLWYFFKPGYEVRTPRDSQIQLYRIAKVTGGRDPVSLTPQERAMQVVPGEDINRASTKFKDDGYSEGSFIIECFYIHYDGTRFGPVNASFQIRKFDGERDITALPVVPLQWYENKDEIRKRLLERGDKFKQLSHPKERAHRRYKGLTLDKNPEQVESEVIIDFELAFIQTKIDKPSLGLQDRLVSDNMRELRDSVKTMHPMCEQAGCCGNDITFNDYEVDELERNEFRDKDRDLFDTNIEDPSLLKSKHIILLPPHVYGFVLRTRRWATFDIDLLKEIPRNEDAWENLVIDPDIKKTVLGLVTNHERQADAEKMINGGLSSVDLVPGKGRGLIILLHGEPGVGKTSTAECVAAYTKRPLFPITCGDIGDKAEAVETNLEKNFQLAHKWGCVLLLDEADIFLSARSEEDIQRNAIVSGATTVYGILFLTTNRVGKIDRAFKSRIHVSLLYKKLDLKRTLRIWDNNLKMVREKLGIASNNTEIMEFAKDHYKRLKRSPDLVVWNARQIRNAFQTAVAIAAYESYGAHGNSGNTGLLGTVLEASHFEKVAKSAVQFDRYLKQASDRTDPEHAKEFNERDDEYMSQDEEGNLKKQPKKRSRGGSRSRRKSNKRDESMTEDSDDDSDDGKGRKGDKESWEVSDSDSDSDSEDEKARRQSKKRKRARM
ncbi:uncharacterized protein B0T15DRAFT_396394 [Chaetomium strumarium]|uniref:AAA+ ATPase domain-containing protein n=1 Tax=Chaetomium strumarium TaxID=1170767 RepID=A0AAJ0GT77_9PEZI|nr:hypothetical protein B0T15DRAFT_396394 [Chaetomium strumarium]